MYLYSPLSRVFGVFSGHLGHTAYHSGATLQVIDKYEEEKHTGGINYLG